MYQDIARNRRNSALLVGGVIGLVSAVGYLYGQLTGDAWSGLILALGASTLGTAITWFSGDKIALAAAGAQPIEKREQLPEVWNLVENISITAGLPMPKLYLIHDPSPNAFATGRDPEHASIAVTTGLIERLERVELEGVIAHELAHVQNYDTRWMVLVAVLVGSLTLLSDFFFRFGGIGKRDRGSGNVGTILMIVGIILLILAPIVGQVIKLAISRKREFLADASGALLTRYPEGLASALEKISQTATPMERASNATAHLWISSPFADKKAPGFLQKLFSTHPPIEERVRALRTMGN